MKNSYKIPLAIGFLINILLSQNNNSASVSNDRSISPSIEIRYDDFLSDFSPSSAIGMILKIDEDRYTGFDVDTATNETRILVGWKWSLLGVSVKEITLPDDSVDHVSMYSFGVKYNVLDNMNTTIEYVLSGDENTSDFLRLAIGVQF